MRAVSMLAILLLVVDRTLAGRENFINPTEESWISAENFTTLIKKSFLYSKCCNIYLSESIHAVEALFNQFRNIYPYEYLLCTKTYECQGYFLLASADEEIERAMKQVPRRVHSFISTTEILIIVDNELQHNSRIFNVSLYGNSNANIVSRSGIWTLSENYLEPRFFLNVNTFDELMNEFDIINMRGREVQVSTFYRPPITYVKTTTKKVIKGVVEEIYPLNNVSEKDGVEMKIFLLLAEKLNFTWTIRSSGKYRYGRRNGSEWHGGVIELLRNKSIDLAFGNIWLTADNNEFVNMSEPWHQVSIHFLVPRPKSITSFWALTRPFSLGIWTLLLIMLLTTSIYMCARARIDSRFPKRFRCFLITITELTGRLLGTWVPRNTANARFELNLWQIVSVVLVTAYCSSLAARLASAEYENSNAQKLSISGHWCMYTILVSGLPLGIYIVRRIDTVCQFLDTNLSWGRKGQVPAYSDYFDMDDPHLGQMPSRYIQVTDDEMTHRLITTSNHKYAILGRVLGPLFFPEDDVMNEDLKGYRMMKQKVGNYYLSFAVEPWLLQPINKDIMYTPFTYRVLKKGGTKF